MFLPVVLFTYWMVPRRCVQGRNLILLVASYIFYAYWDYRFLGLIVFSTLVDYAAALFIQASEQTGRKRSALILSLIVNLGILGYFKYFDFFIESALTVLNQLGFSGQYTSLGIILPVGISFYTFQSMSYTIDVFRKRQKAERNPLYVALYVAFFPQLMAGPIERAGTFIPQLKDQRELYFGNLIKGFHRFLLGMVKKVVVSGPITAYTTLQWLNPALRSTEEVWFMSILFFLALLMDFSGYSDMAIGIARMFGIQLSENFTHVFKAKTLRRFGNVGTSPWVGGSEITYSYP
jgi:D-alanyl-lipoteichoic acid acyltransferase DltB (MBOAT superfamily)